MAGEAQVARIYGQATLAPTAYIADIRGQVATAPTAMVAELRGEAQTPASALIAAIRGESTAGGNSPTATAGQALALQPGASFRLAGAGTAPAGAVLASYAWRVVSKSANAGTPTFSNPAARNARVRVPVVRKASWYVFGLTVTDSAGRRSPEATVRVDVRQAQLLAASSTGWRPIGIDPITDPGQDVTL